MPLEMRQILDVRDEANKTIHFLMGLGKSTFLKQADSYTFMKKHKMSTVKQDALMENLGFSKKFFEIIDEDGSGSIDIKELAEPLIALGLATDSVFLKKALKMLNPGKFGQGDFTEEIKILEFSRIFRINHVQEKLIDMIKTKLD